MGCCCGGLEWDFTRTNQKHTYSPVAVDGGTQNTTQVDQNNGGNSYGSTNTTPKAQTPTKSKENPFKSVKPIDDNESVSVSESQDTESESFKEYRKMMTMVFYTFAGYKPYAKKVGLFMYKMELKKFLEIVNVDSPVDEVLKLIDTDIEDGKITFNEWMDYFTNQDINVDIFRIKEHIEAQVTWELLVKALKIFQKMDADHSGKLEYGEFENFGSLIGLNAQETEVLWHQMDVNESGSVDITELFEWFRNRLYQQRRRICSKRQSSLLLSDEASKKELENVNSE